MTIIFWMSVILLVYPYLGYPMVLTIFGRFRPFTVARADIAPKVSILIAAYNEEECIERTIRNKLELNYPQENLEIIVVSDGSRDGTDQVVKSIQSRRLMFIRQEPNQGKAAALNLAVSHASGAILVFSDANTLFHKDALRNIVSNFNDPRVGYVTGDLVISSGAQSGSGVEEGISAYMKFERWLRQLESKFYCVIGVNGGVDAMRRSLYRDVPRDQISDFVLPLWVMRNDYRVIYDSSVMAWEYVDNDMQSEFKMRARVALRGLGGLAYMRELLNPVAYPKPAFSVYSHKVIRYLSPVFLIGALVANISLIGSGVFYVLCLLAQIVFYGFAWLGLKYKENNLLGKLSKMSAYFVMTAISFGLSIVRFSAGKRQATWTPRKG